MSTFYPHPGPMQTTYGIAMPIYLSGVDRTNASRVLSYIAHALSDLNCIHWEVTVGHTVEGDRQLLIDPNAWCAIVDLYRPKNTYEMWVDDRVDELVRKLGTLLERFIWSQGVAMAPTPPGSEAESESGHSNQAQVGSSSTLTSTSWPGSSLSHGHGHGQRRMSMSMSMTKVMMKFHPKRIFESFEARTGSRLRKMELRHKYKLVVFNDIPMLVCFDSQVVEPDSANCRHLFGHLEADDALGLEHCLQKLRKAQRWKAIYHRLGDREPTYVSAAANMDASSRPKSSHSRTPDLEHSQRKTSQAGFSKPEASYASSRPKPSQSKTLDPENSQRRTLYAERSKPETSQAESSHSRKMESRNSQRRSSVFDFDDLHDSLLGLAPFQPEATGALQARPVASATATSGPTGRDSQSLGVGQRPQSRNTSSRSDTSPLLRVSVQRRASDSTSRSVRQARRKSVITVNIYPRDRE
ncbi:uncharacterized protein BDV17DRAFT_296358 [Aspergillus undulatus]|uniref:uncharacterized protein n=1 Tax=Aspergillus undulatus TaxID=1810928 RepID=UPI003CCD77B5